MEHIRAFPRILSTRSPRAGDEVASPESDDVSSMSEAMSVEPNAQPDAPRGLSMQWAASVEEDGSLRLRATWE